MDSYYSDAVASYVGSTAYTVSMLISLVIGVITLIGLWKVYNKADEPGWAVIVPFYNQYVLFKITFGNGWLFLLLLIPCVGMIMLIIAYFKLAGAFGKGVGFGFGLWLLNPIFVCILGFGDARYIGVSK